jgi:hypothetical protein
VRDIGIIGLMIVVGCLAVGLLFGFGLLLGLAVAPTGSAAA